jgi:hypothetical protein
MIRSVGLGVVLALLALTAVTSDESPSTTQAAPERRTVATSPGVPTAPVEVPRSTERRREMRILSNGCNYDTRGIPRCGALLGAAYGSNSSPRRWERSMGRGLGVHRTYYDGDGVDEAVETARTDLRHNRVPWMSFKLPFSWEEMRDGRGDNWTRGLARRLSDLNGPVWLAFHHEPEGDGDVRAWTQMQARLAPIVRRTAPNVAYSIILTGWNQFYGHRNYSLDKIWPRKTRIDLVGFDVFDKYGVSSKDSKRVDHTDFERDYFPRFRAFARKHKVAWGLSETGHTDRSAKVNPQWVQRTYQALSRNDGVALSYFNTHLNSIAPWRLKGAKEKAFATTLRNTPTL